MSLSRPSARLSIDGNARAADEAALLRLRVELTIGGSHDAASIELWPHSAFAGTAPGAQIEVALGERDSEAAVLTGKVNGRERTPRGVRLDVLASTAALSRTTKSQSYRGQSVADIVRDLAGAVSLDQVDASLALDAYHVDNRVPVWMHLQSLAALVGADLGSAADGSLRFVPATSPTAPMTLRYGAELLDWAIEQCTAEPAASVSAWGAASEAGASRWSWPRHDPVGAGAAPTRLIGALSSRDAAQSVGDALSAAAARASLRGTLVVPGRPGVRPGDAVETSGLPGGDPGTLRVRAVRHDFDASFGFITRLQIEGGGSGGPGASIGALG
jgi:phage protein D